MGQCSSNSADFSHPLSSSDIKAVIGPNGHHKSEVTKGTAATAATGGVTRSSNSSSDNAKMRMLMEIKENKLRKRANIVMNTGSHAAVVNDSDITVPDDSSLQGGLPTTISPTLTARKLKRKIAKLTAESQGRWLVFNSIDMYDQRSLRSLAAFMEMAIRYIPSIQDDDHLTRESLSHLEKSLQLKSLEILTADTTPSSSRVTSLGRGQSSPLLGSPTRLTRKLPVEDSITSPRTPRLSQRLSFDQLSFEDDRLSRHSSFHDGDMEGFEENRSYDLTTKSVTLTEVTRIIAIFRAGGRLTTKAIHTILRQSYRTFTKLPNVSRMTIREHEKLTVVGDIHGQLSDLLHILDESGMPSYEHKYVFNGDFVDRGSQGVEVMCILLAMLTAYGPQNVILNRGNHEDFLTCSIYGFQKEVLAKYDETTFAMFIEIFSHMPLYGVINDAIFIVHGGLFHTPYISLTDLDKMRRYECSLMQPMQSYDRLTYHQQLQKETLWSDPKTAMGIGHSSRGAGVAFGPDITKQFLEYNHLKFVIRSHECVRSGFERPYVGCGTEYENLLCTLFSASSYSDGNTAAYMEIFPNSHHSSKRIPDSVRTTIADSGLMYVIHHYNTVLNGSQHDNDNDTGSALSAESDLTCADIDIPLDLLSLDECDNLLSSVAVKNTAIATMIHQKRFILYDAFVVRDVNHDGIVPEECFYDLMEHILKYHLNWRTLLPGLIEEVRLCFPDLEEGTDGDLFKQINGIASVDFINFLNLFNEDPTAIKLAAAGMTSPNSTTDSDGEGGEVATTEEKSTLLTALYANYSQYLEMIFHFFDVDQDEYITFPEFEHQCELLNSHMTQLSTTATLPMGQQQQQLSTADVSELFELMDIKQCGEIDMNIFFEIFRQCSTQFDLKSILSTLESQDIDPLAV